MSVSLWVGDRSWLVGSASFLHAFFSTVAARLEDEGWGSRFPTLMRGLYGGELSHGATGAALRELTAVRAELARLTPKHVVWDFDDRRAAPPWGSDVDPRVTTLADYFLTSDGKDLFAVFAEALEEAQRARRDISIR